LTGTEFRPRQGSKAGANRTRAHAAESTSPAELVRTLCRSRQLIGQLVWRDIVGRYRGSLAGLGWSFFNPLLMLAVYTFVFSFVFDARWSADATAGTSRLSYSVVIFAGLIVHQIFAEGLSRSPSLITSQPNFVKKIIFPLEVLPVVVLCSSLFHAVISFVVLIFGSWLLVGSVSWTLFTLPLVIGPLALATLGVVWALSAASVYLRDLAQTTGIISAIALFLSPVFYSTDKVPGKLQWVVNANPLSFIIEQTRAVAIWGRAPDWIGLALYWLGSVVVAYCGYWCFRKARKGFADVL